MIHTIVSTALPRTWAVRSAALLAAAMLPVSLLSLAGAAPASAAKEFSEDLEVITGNTPYLRLHQSGGGWGAYEWDVAGNESNFFVRDVAENKLPLRIRPGAPTSSVDISGDGDVGIGTSVPDAPLDVAKGGADLNGTLREAANEANVSGLEPVDGAAILAQLRALPVSKWTYGSASAGKHIGPLAADFAAAYGLGDGEEHVSPADVAGVALAGVKQLDLRAGSLRRRVDGLAADLAEAEGGLTGEFQGLADEVGELADRLEGLEGDANEAGGAREELMSSAGKLADWIQRTARANRVLVRRGARMSRQLRVLRRAVFGKPSRRRAQR